MTVAYLAHLESVLVWDSARKVIETGLHEYLDWIQLKLNAVSGDLSQSLGAPVKKGEVLFTVAPLDSYRVILEVDEREIADVTTGMQGHLALSAIPGELLPFTVEKLTPISTAADGRNFFRVEASLGSAFASLRPGMEGVGKIDAGDRRLAWLFTHDLFDWLRLWLWLNF